MVFAHFERIVWIKGVWTIAAVIFYLLMAVWTLSIERKRVIFDWNDTLTANLRVAEAKLDSCLLKTITVSKILQPFMWKLDHVYTIV